MDEEGKPLTAFTVGPFGFYECERMPFRLTNTPATFQRLIKTCLGDLNLHWCIIYLDDIVIFSKNLASHLERLEAVFQKLEKAGLKLKSSKCELFWWQIAYLGHVIFTQGVATDKGKIDAIKNWPTPSNVTEAWSFLGFMGYYNWFIPKFSQVAQTLHELMSGENMDTKRQPFSGTASVNRPLMNWRDTVQLHLFLHMLHQAIEASQWCLWLWFGSCPLPDLWGWHRCHNSLCQ